MSVISIQHGEGDGRAGDKSRQMNWTLLAFNLAVMMSRGEKGRSWEPRRGCLADLSCDCKAEKSENDSVTGEPPSHTHTCMTHNETECQCSLCTITLL